MRYSVPEIFAENLFDMFPDDDRPDYRWVIVGPELSGSRLHIDPYSKRTHSIFFCTESIVIKSVSYFPVSYFSGEGPYFMSKMTSNTHHSKRFNLPLGNGPEQAKTKYFTEK